MIIDRYSPRKYPQLASMLHPLGERIRGRNASCGAGSWGVSSRIQVSEIVRIPVLPAGIGHGRQNVRNAQQPRCAQAPMATSNSPTCGARIPPSFGAPGNTGPVGVTVEQWVSRRPLMPFAGRLILRCSNTRPLLLATAALRAGPDGHFKFPHLWRPIPPKLRSTGEHRASRCHRRTVGVPEAAHAVRREADLAM
jgi:hypothetical protein